MTAPELFAGTGTQNVHLVSFIDKNSEFYLILLGILLE